MNDKRRRPQRLFTGTHGTSNILRQAQSLRERQSAWNAMLDLEVQDHTWLVGWSTGALEVLCQSSVWHTWLRRHEKKILKRWNTQFPDTPAHSIQASVKPWIAQLPAAASPPSKMKLRGTLHNGPQRLREAGEQMTPPIAAAVRRLADTLEQLQAEAVTRVSAKEKGAAPSE
ncbi:MAG: DciA family protein [Acidithiobacillus sp.]